MEKVKRYKVKMKKMHQLVLIVFLFVLIGVTTHAQTPAFPTAEGYGKWVTGGRGGKVVEVTNLLDIDRSGNTVKGSFRWALKEYPGEPIVIVFGTSGIIQLSGELRIKRDNFTIAGQTAPGDGICIKGGSVNFGGSKNIIIRHVRFRLGLDKDEGFIAGACLNIENAGSFIVDHCSFSWSGEENIGVYNNQPFTIQWCISAEGLYDAGHSKGARSYGAVLGGEKATYHHNLLAHNNSRSPRFGTSDKNDHNVLIEYINNVNYNWGQADACYGGENELGPVGSVSINFVNNYYKPGPAYPGTKKSKFVAPTYEVGLQDTFYTKWHVSGNMIEGVANQSLNSDNWLGIDISEYRENVPDVTQEDLMAEMHATPYPIEVETAEEAYASVIDNCGAFPRDSFDSRIISELVSGTASASGSWGGGGVYGIVDKPSDSGGYPTYSAFNFIEDKDKDGMGDYWEMANGLDTTDTEDRNNLTKEGYTYLEVYLNSIVGEFMDGFTYPEPIYIKDTSDIPSSIDLNKAITNITVYPNPMSSSLNIGFNTRKAIDAEFSILNITGSTIYAEKRRLDSKSNVIRIDLTNLDPGIYFLNIKNEKFTDTHRFIKK